MAVEVKVVDERRLTIPIRGVSATDTRKIGDFFVKAVEEGYVLAQTKSVMASDYRNESYQTGVEFIFRRQA